MIKVKGSTRFLWTVNKLNKISNNECCNFQAICTRVGLGHYKVDAFLEISNSIMDKTVDFGPLLAKYELQEAELDNLAANGPSILAF